ncbi:hypothetical protein MO973_11335 [Paenibacillus sp. TRM 82003]|nr:hypothetical protein [Paenibacillus sp. TRM 82003]
MYRGNREGLLWKWNEIAKSRSFENESSVLKASWNGNEGVLPRFSDSERAL